MPATAQDYEQQYKQVEDLRKQAKGKSLSASQLEASESTFADQVMDKVRAHRAERGLSTLGQDYAGLTGQLATYAPARQERLGGEVDPMAIEQLNAQTRGNLLSTLQWIASAMGEQEGDIAEIIQSGANKLLAAAARKKAEAQAAEYEASSLLEMIKAKQAETQREFERGMLEKEFDEGVRQFNVRQASKGGSGGGGIASGLSSDYYEEVQGLTDAVYDSDLTPEQRQEYLARQTNLIAQKYGVPLSTVQSDAGYAQPTPTRTSATGTRGGYELAGAAERFSVPKQIRGAVGLTKDWLLKSGLIKKR